MPGNLFFPMVCYSKCYKTEMWFYFSLFIFIHFKLWNVERQSKVEEKTAQSAQWITGLSNMNNRKRNSFKCRIMVE